MIRDVYFEWLCGLIDEQRYSGRISYRKLLVYLHDTKFRYLIPNDQNRAEDGISLRYRFSLEMGFNDIPAPLDGPCSVLEMIIAVAIHCEEHMMDDPKFGDRTGQWFWGMISNLGLGSMYNSRFDREYVEDVIERFMDRDYAPDGRGGLFTIRNCDEDLRDMEIFYQLCRYVDNFI